MAEQDVDRNAKATPYKLQKARERGQVAKSTDTVGVVVLAVAVTYAHWQGFDSVLAQVQFDGSLLTHALQQRDFSSSVFWYLASQMTMQALQLMAPLFGALLVAAILANVLQTGPVLSVEPLKADFDRINPASGLKRMFSMRTLFDGARASLKLTVLVLVASGVFRDQSTHEFLALASLSGRGFLHELVTGVTALCFKMVMALLILAMLDLLYTRYEFAKKMRMSQKELKDEHKNREGDPRIKARLRDLRREWLKRSQAIRKTSGADVVITNPTHIAVALRYEHGRMASPLIVAKGSGSLAQAMRDMAARHRIPVVRNPTLARRLFKELPVDQFVPPELYAQVARIIVWVFAMREQTRQRAADAGGTA